MAKYAKMAVEVIDLDKVEMPEVKKEEPKKPKSKKEVGIYCQSSCPHCGFSNTRLGMPGETQFFHCSACGDAVGAILR